MHELTFTSTQFPVLPHEDEKINPGLLGRSLANWIKACLHGTRFEITEDIDEDFGYCLMVHRTPYWLWIGCAGHSDHFHGDNGLDASVAAAFPLASIEWRIFVASERGLLSKLLGRDTRERDKEALLALLKEKLSALPDVVIA